MENEIDLRREGESMMKRQHHLPRALLAGVLALSCDKPPARSVTVPVTLDHNRMLVQAEMQRRDGSWRQAWLWVDTGNPHFFMSAPLARDLGMELPEAVGNVVVSPPTGIRIGGMVVDLSGITARVITEPAWLFRAAHNDANLPSTVLQRYQVVFDYPAATLTLAAPGTLPHRGERATAAIHPQTGVLQIDAVIDGDSLSLALDNGASYSFVSEPVLESISRRHPDRPRLVGTLGCANMWGWWPPGEEAAPVMRVPVIQWGPVCLTDVGLVGVRAVSANGPTLGPWYSEKTAHPVEGLLGPNAFKAYRVEIDYAGSAVYFEKGAGVAAPDLDLVGLTLRPEPDGVYRVIGVAQRDGRSAVPGVEPGDTLLRVGDLSASGATMGTVVDALRGAPGETRVLELERQGKRITVLARVERFL
jgi:hypothetical protein